MRKNTLWEQCKHDYLVVCRGYPRWLVFVVECIRIGGCIALLIAATLDGDWAIPLLTAIALGAIFWQRLSRRAGAS
jgi:hypothetical protein